MTTPARQNPVLIEVSVGTHQPTTYEQENECACDPSSFTDQCIQGEAGYKQELDAFAQELVNTALSSMAYSRLLGVEVDVKGNGKMCVCCAEVEGQGVYGVKVEGSLSTSISAKVWIGPSLNWKQQAEVPVWPMWRPPFSAGSVRRSDSPVSPRSRPVRSACCRIRSCVSKGGSTPPILLVAR
ncbi:MAG: hypothetical protein H7A46_08530 [Verrucomicrobiales bacterium]|nr:hypothetical protein [Verrucomicrobiales bacterium]